MRYSCRQIDSSCVHCSLRLEDGSKWLANDMTRNVETLTSELSLVG